MSSKTSFAAVVLASAMFGSMRAEEDSRLEQIAAAQDEKAGSTHPEVQGRTERALLWIKDGEVLERFRAGIDGFRVKIGGLAPGSGFAAGPEFRRTDLLNGSLTVRAAAQSSFRGYRKFDLELGAPKLSNGRVFAELYAVHHDYPSLGYYGPGPDSNKSGRTNFRLEDTSIDATVGVRPTRRFTAGFSAGYLFNNVGPGTDSRYASTEQVYLPAQAPGIDVQYNFQRVATFAQFDWRDNPAGPRRGGNYFAQFSDYRDRTAGLADFRRLTAEAQQYLPVLNERRVFALRARTALTFRDRNQPIPFYMLPSLGGSEDLRGYRPFRFRDENLLLLNAEYRWEVFSGLDMALFADGGKVFPRKSDFNLRHLESDAGFGFRFNARNQTFLRLDVGFSHEGFQVWIRFNGLFKKGPVHTSSSMEDL